MNTKSSADSLQRDVWRVVAQLARLPPEPPETGHELGALLVCFRALCENSEPGRSAAEDQIWAIWSNHPEEQLTAQMARGIRLLATGELARAEVVFDRLIERDPKWAEAWNKRATVYFLQGRDSASIGDIFHTLELEPRHFGALGGFAQVCMRNGAPDAARAALERLLAVNPGASGIVEALAALEKHHPKIIH